MAKWSLVEVYKEINEVLCRWMLPNILPTQQWQYMVVGQGLIEQCALVWLNNLPYSVTARLSLYALLLSHFIMFPFFCHAVLWCVALCFRFRVLALLHRDPSQVPLGVHSRVQHLQSVNVTMYTYTSCLYDCTTKLPTLMKVWQIYLHMQTSQLSQWLTVSAVISQSHGGGLISHDLLSVSMADLSIHTTRGFNGCWEC